MNISHSAVDTDAGQQATPARESAREYLILDVFTQTPLRGNQLGVFPASVGLSAEQMQQLARELNFSETVFVLPPEGDGDARIRIFTPRHELPFAGHPTLGSAFVVGDSLGRDTVKLECELGVIPVALERDGGGSCSGACASSCLSGARTNVQASCSQRLGSSARSCRSRPTPTARSTSSLHSPARTRLGRWSQTSLRWRLWERWGSTASRAVASAGRRAFSAPLTACQRTPRPARPPGRSRSTSRHGWIAFGEQIEIRQGAELGHPSALYARVEGSPERLGLVEVGGSAVVVARGQFLL